MRIISYFFILTIALLSCNDFKTESEKDWINVKNSNSIEEYQNYLIKNPQTKYLKEITDSLKLFWKRNALKDLSHYNHFNSLNIDIYKNYINFDGFIIKKDKLSDTIKYSILNPYGLQGLPEKDIVQIDGIGNFVSSKAIINIRSDKDTSPKLYSEIIEIVKNTFTDLRNEYANKIYNKNLNTLDEKQKEEILKIVPMKIWFEKTRPAPPVPSAHIDSIFTVRQEDEKEFENEINKNAL